MFLKSHICNNNGILHDKKYKNIKIKTKADYYTVKTY